MSRAESKKSNPHTAIDRQPVINRLNRIAGQVSGVARMMAERRYCIDILTQLQAVKAALSKVEDEVLKEHAAHCLDAAVASGDARDQRQKFAELVELVSKVKR